VVLHEFMTFTFCTRTSRGEAGGSRKNDRLAYEPGERDKFHPIRATHNFGLIRKVLVRATWAWRVGLKERGRGEGKDLGFGGEGWRPGRGHPYTKFRSSLDRWGRSLQELISKTGIGEKEREWGRTMGEGDVVEFPTEGYICVFVQ